MNFNIKSSASLIALQIVLGFSAAEAKVDPSDYCPTVIENTSKQTSATVKPAEVAPVVADQNQPDSVKSTVGTMKPAVSTDSGISVDSSASVITTPPTKLVKKSPQIQKKAQKKKANKSGRAQQSPGETDSNQSSDNDSSSKSSVSASVSSVEPDVDQSKNAIRFKKGMFDSNTLTEEQKEACAALEAQEKMPTMENITNWCCLKKLGIDPSDDNNFYRATLFTKVYSTPEESVFLTTKAQFDHMEALQNSRPGAFILAMGFTKDERKQKILREGAIAAARGETALAERKETLSKEEVATQEQLVTLGRVQVKAAKKKAEKQAEAAKKIAKAEEKENKKAAKAAKKANKNKKSDETDSVDDTSETN